MANKYHRQGFLNAGLVKKLLTSKADKGEMLMKLLRETKKISSPKFFKDRFINIKNIGPDGKPLKVKKEILSVDDFIDIQNMSNNQLKKQIQKYGFIVGTKNKKLADRSQRGGSLATQKIMKSIIRNFIAKRVAGRSDDGIMITLTDPKKVDFQAAMMEDLLMRNGIDPNAIQSEEQLKMLLNQINVIQKQSTTTSGIRNAESAKVFEIATGKEMPKGSKIMGGEAVETEAEIAARLQNENKTGLLKIKQRQKMLEEAIDDASPGFADDIKYDSEIVAENLAERMGLVYDDMPTKERLDLYDTAYKGLAKQRFKNQKTPKGDDPEEKADGGRIGYFMGSQFPKGAATLRNMAQYFGKKSDVIKKPSDILSIVNPKRLNELLNNPEIYGKFDVKKGIAAPDLVKDMQKQMMFDRQKTIEEMLGAAKNIKRADDSILKNKNDMIQDMMSKGVDRNMAEEMANTISKMAKGAAGKIDTPKLTDEGILELENILKNMETGGKKKRDLNADGGRIGYKDGPGMNRRTFLKLLGGFLSIPIIGKIVKPLKTVKGVKNVPVIKTDNVPGKPEWFDQLVNKVIIEGDDVTKRFATQEREIVHTKKINNTDEVTVYQDLNTDSVRVEYNSPKNMLEEPVDLSYKRTPPDEGAPRGSAEFEVTESGFVGRADGPDDYFIDAEPVGGSRIKDLDSDVSALKEYATGKGPTMKEFVQKKKRIDKVKKINEGDLDERSQYITDRQGDYDPGPEEFASGGIAGMLGE